MIGSFTVRETAYVDTTAREARFLYDLLFLDRNLEIVSEIDRVVSAPSYAIDAEPVQTMTEDSYMVSMGDVDGDGLLEVLGSWNDGSGSFLPESALAIGLEPVFADGRVPRDTRLADLDGDGDLDVVANTYAPIDDQASRAQLYWNDGTGFFERDLDFESMDLRGFGETILTFDFDNDGDLDIFLPYYTHDDSLEQCYLLRNEGGFFVDVAHEAGVAMQGVPVGLRVEGAQAADLNDDGWIDFYVGSHLFINQGDGTFHNVQSAAGLPLRFDEGAFFSDWDLDGDLDLILHHPTDGPELHEQIGLSGSSPRTPIFTPVPDAFPVISGRRRFGASGGDLNLDGYEDLQVASGTDDPAIILVNLYGRYEDVTSEVLAHADFRTSIGAIADLDADGVPDIARRANGARVHFHRGSTPVAHMPVIEVLVTGEDGLRNQQGRVVRLTPVDEPGVVIARVVDGGSGYMSQRPYAMTVGSPYPGLHLVEVQFPDRLVSVLAGEGDSVELRSDGQVFVNASEE
jgi:hypothetical protein